MPPKPVCLNPTIHPKFEVTSQDKCSSRHTQDHHHFAQRLKQKETADLKF